MKVLWFELEDANSRLNRQLHSLQPIDVQLYKRTLGQYILSPVNRENLDAVPRWIRNIEANTTERSYSEIEWSDDIENAFQQEINNAFDSLLDSSLSDLVDIYIGKYKTKKDQNLSEHLRLKVGKDWKLRDIENDANRDEFIQKLMRRDKPDIYALQQKILEEDEPEYDDKGRNVGRKVGKLLTEDELFKPLSNISIRNRFIHEGKSNEEQEITATFWLDHSMHIPHSKTLSQAFPNQKIKFIDEEQTMKYDATKPKLEPLKLFTGLDTSPQEIEEEEALERLDEGQRVFGPIGEIEYKEGEGSYIENPKYYKERAKKKRMYESVDIHSDEYKQQMEAAKKGREMSRTLQLDSESRGKLNELFMSPTKTKLKEWLDIMTRNDSLYQFLLGVGMPMSVLVAGRYKVQLVLRDVKLKDNIEVSNTNSNPIWTFNITSKLSKALLQAPSETYKRQQFDFGGGQHTGTKPIYATEFSKEYYNKKKELENLVEGTPEHKKLKEEVDLLEQEAREETKGKGHNESREYLMDVVQGRIQTLRDSAPYLGSGPNG